MSRGKFYLIAIVAVILYLVFLFVVFKALSPAKSSPPSPSPANSADTIYYKGETNQAGKLDRIRDFIIKLPYSGRFFQLSYDSQVGNFLLNIDPDHKNEGVAEFNQYLGQNGFNSQSDLVNLKTSYKNLP